MANTFMNGLKSATNFAYTENGAVTHRTTQSDLLDMFALGGAYRSRSDEDVILLFKNAYAENPVYALKCLFYLRDVRGGQGERRFFRVCMKWLAQHDSEAAARNLQYIPEFGRWDDLYIFVGTKLETKMFRFIKEQLALDVQCNTPSLLAKWLKSENASSKETCALGVKTASAMGMTRKQYRKTLSLLRSRINIVEKLMSENRWDEIEFDKIPSKAGLIYKNAFARRDIIKAKFETFIKDEKTKVNASVLNPVDIAHQIFYSWKPTDIERAAWDKYWANLKDYYNGREENGLAIVDVSGSMSGVPMEAAVSMGAYIAERGHGPFANHFVTFSGNPQLVRFDGVDLYDKFNRAKSADWGMNTNIEAVFNMLLKVATENKCTQDEIPQTLYIFSDMEFDGALTTGPVTNDRWGYSVNKLYGESAINTLLENIAARWKSYGYELPRVIFWNLDARHDNIPALGGRFSYISGFSMNMIEQVLSGKDGYDLMMEKLDTERYACIK